jgi:hypothetical protein
LSQPNLFTKPGILAAMRAWAEGLGLSWDADNDLPEPVCGGCKSPINIWDGEEACPDCDDCETCCWDNHGDAPHAGGA